MKTLRYTLFLLVLVAILSSCDEPPVLQPNHFSFSAKSIETMRATLEVETKESSMYYYVGLLPKWKFEQIGGKDSVSSYAKATPRSTLAQTSKTPACSGTQTTCSTATD